MNSVDNNYNKSIFELNIKLSAIENLICDASKLSDKSVFFHFNSNDIIIKSSISHVSLTRENVELYEIYKEDEKEYEIQFNAYHFIMMLKDILVPEIDIIIKLVKEFVLIFNSKLSEIIENDILIKMAEDLIMNTLPDLEYYVINELVKKSINIFEEMLSFNCTDNSIINFSENFIKMLQEIKGETIIKLFVLERECKKMVICYEEPKIGKKITCKINIK